jgi:hypothetical protein
MTFWSRPPSSIRFYDYFVTQVDNNLKKNYRWCFIWYSIYEHMYFSFLRAENCCLTEIFSWLNIWEQRSCCDSTIWLWNVQYSNSDCCCNSRRKFNKTKVNTFLFYFSGVQCESG